MLPAVPIRQWVLTMPPRVRYLLAWNHDLTRAVVAVYLRAVMGWLRRRNGRRGVRGGRAGAVAIIQRFGGGLNLNVHVHALVTDGAFVRARGRVRFRRARPPAPGEVVRLLDTIAHRIRRLLVRRGVGDDDAGLDVTDPWREEQPVLAHLAAASVRGVAALGARLGAPVRRWGDTIDLPKSSDPGRWRARVDGFDLHAGIAVSARNRARLEQLCRYALRPAVGQDRLQAMPDGMDTGAHGLRTLTGAWVAAEGGNVPAGSFAVAMNQKLARLAFYLVAPTSDDGLVTWNFLDEMLDEGVKEYPILRKR